MKNCHTPRLLKAARGLLISAPLVLALGTTSAMASQLVYTPVNPSFGGYALNGPYLLSIAQQQAKKNAPDPLAGLDLSAFNESLDQMNSKLDQLIDDQSTSSGGGTTTP